MSQRQDVFTIAARAWCEAKFDYPPPSYNSPEDRERHIENDAASTAQEQPFRAAVQAVIDTVAARIEEEAARLREQDWPGKVGIEYVNGFEDVAQWMTGQPRRR